MCFGFDDDGEFWNCYGYYDEECGSQTTWNDDNYVQNYELDEPMWTYHFPDGSYCYGKIYDTYDFNCRAGLLNGCRFSDTQDGGYWCANEEEGWVCYGNEQTDEEYD